MTNAAYLIESGIVPWSPQDPRAETADTRYSTLTLALTHNESRIRELCTGFELFRGHGAVLVWNWSVLPSKKSRAARYLAEKEFRHPSPALSELAGEMIDHDGCSYYVWVAKLVAVGEQLIPWILDPVQLFVADSPSPDVNDYLSSIKALDLSHESGNEDGLALTSSLPGAAVSFAHGEAEAWYVREFFGLTPLISALNRKLVPPAWTGLSSREELMAWLFA